MVSVCVRGCTVWIITSRNGLWSLKGKEPTPGGGSLNRRSTSKTSSRSPHGHGSLHPIFGLVTMVVATLRFAAEHKIAPRRHAGTVMRADWRKSGIGREQPQETEGPATSLLPQTRHLVPQLGIVGQDAGPPRIGCTRCETGPLRAWTLSAPGHVATALPRMGRRCARRPPMRAIRLVPAPCIVMRAASRTPGRPASSRSSRGPPTSMPPRTRPSGTAIADGGQQAGRRESGASTVHIGPAARLAAVGPGSQGRRPPRSGQWRLAAHLRVARAVRHLLRYCSIASIGSRRIRGGFIRGAGR
jgi:hypothetical protein